MVRVTLKAIAFASAVTIGLAPWVCAFAGIGTHLNLFG
jgi:hypothetical protein